MTIITQITLNYCVTTNTSRVTSSCEQVWLKDKSTPQGGSFPTLDTRPQTFFVLGRAGFLTMFSITV